MIEKILKKAKTKNIDLEILENHEKRTEIEIYNEQISKFIVADTKTYQLKSIIDGKSILINTQKLDDTIFEQLKSYAFLSDNTDEDSFATGNIEGPSISDNYQEKLVSQIKEFIAIKKQEPNIETILASISFNNHSLTIQNTKGANLKDSHSKIILALEVATNQNGQTNSKMLIKYMTQLNFTEFKKLLEQTIQAALEVSNNRGITSYTGKVILKNNVVSEILDCYSDSFLSETITKKQSVFENYIGKKVASEIVTIVEDPTNETLPGKRLFDNEGTKTFYKEVVKDGIFKTILYNNSEASKNAVASTANSYGVTNFYIKPTNNTFNDLVSKLNSGIIISEVIGIDTGTNSLTGDISLQANGYQVQNGCITEPITLFILDTNIKDLLNNILMIGNDLIFPNSHVGGVSLLVDEIRLVGQGGN